MDEVLHDAAPAQATFGRRKIKPHVCIVESKQHVLLMLSDILEEQGFISSRCESARELDGLLATLTPDLVVVTASVDGLRARDVLHALASRSFLGSILLIGAASAPALVAVQELGTRLGLAMLPALPTPFRDQDLRASVAALVPAQAPPSPPVDVAEALSVGWLELWYQPIVDARSLALSGAEALIRMRHPTWGIVPPAYFLPDVNDPHFKALSEFVIGRVFEDWRYFVGNFGRIHLSINLPISFFQNPDAVSDLHLQCPDHPAFDGLTVEIDSTEIVQDLPLAVETAKRLRFHNIGLRIDDVGVEWPSLMALNEFPFAGIKLDRKFVDGSAAARLKRSVCRQIVDLAEGYGVKTVAEGVETKDDFVAMHELGVDFIQGFLFGKPMTPRKFARSTKKHLGFAQ